MALLRILSGLPELPRDFDPPTGVDSALGLVTLGLFVQETQGLDHAHVIHSRIASALARGLPPDEADVSELSAAALVRSLGVPVGTHVPEADHRTPDWRFRTLSGSDFEVEVTRAQAKPEHDRDADRVVSIGRAVLEDGPARTLTIFIADLAQHGPDELRDMLARLDPGDDSEVEGRIRVECVAPSESTSVVISARVPNLPKWWPSDRLPCMSVQGHLGDGLRSQVTLVYGVAAERYLNPVQRKADRPQGLGEAALVIALDATALPSGVDEIAAAVEAALPYWPAVSAVLTFSGGVELGETDHYLWFWTLVRNPDANIPLPRLPDEPVDHGGRRCETRYPLGSIGSLRQ